MMPKFAAACAARLRSKRRSDCVRRTLTALVLRALHRAIGIEQTTQQPAMEVARIRPRICGVMVLRPGAAPSSNARSRSAADASRHSPRPATGRCQPRKSARCDNDATASLTACMMPLALCIGHDRHALPMTRSCRRPDRQHRLVFAQMSVADQQPEQVAVVAVLLPCQPRDVGGRAAPLHRRAAAVRLRTRRCATHSGCGARPCAHGGRPVSRSEWPSRVRNTKHRLGPGDEETVRQAAMRPAIDHGVEGHADQVAHLPRAFAWS